MIELQKFDRPLSSLMYLPRIFLHYLNSQGQVNYYHISKTHGITKRPQLASSAYSSPFGLLPVYEASLAQIVVFACSSLIVLH